MKTAPEGAVLVLAKPENHSSTKASWRLDFTEGSNTMISKMAAIANKLADKPRVTNTDQSPRDRSNARRKFSSIMGPKMKPSSKGAGSMPNLMNV